MQITNLKIRPKGTQVERIILVSSSVPVGEVINKQEMLAAASLTPLSYCQICNHPKLQPYKFTQRGNKGNLWGKPQTIAKLKKLQAKA